jgi:hypothetical protein
MLSRLNNRRQLRRIADAPDGISGFDLANPWHIKLGEDALSKPTKPWPSPRPRSPAYRFGTSLLPEIISCISKRVRPAEFF